MTTAYLGYELGPKFNGIRIWKTREWAAARSECEPVEVNADKFVTAEGLRLAAITGVPFGMNELAYRELRQMLPESCPL